MPLNNANVFTKSFFLLFFLTTNILSTLDFSNTPFHVFAYLDVLIGRPYPQRKALQNHLPTEYSLFHVYKNRSFLKWYLMDNRVALDKHLFFLIFAEKL